MHPLQTSSISSRRLRSALTLAVLTAGLSACDVDLRDVYRAGRSDAYFYDYSGGDYDSGNETPDAGPFDYGNGCRFAFDGECDEPSLCEAGTDTADCRGIAESAENGGLTPEISSTWLDASTLFVSIGSGREFGPYGFGFALEGWDVEDCIPGNSYGYEICHEVPAQGQLALSSLDVEQGWTSLLDGLMSGSTTVANAAVADSLTYVVIRSETLQCWTWGQTPQHYIDALGCAVY